MPRSARRPGMRQFTPCNFSCPARTYAIYLLHVVDTRGSCATYTLALWVAFCHAVWEPCFMCAWDCGPCTWGTKTLQTNYICRDPIGPFVGRIVCGNNIKEAPPPGRESTYKRAKEDGGHSPAAASAANRHKYRGKVKGVNAIYSPRPPVSYAPFFVPQSNTRSAPRVNLNRISAARDSFIDRDI